MPCNNCCEKDKNGDFIESPCCDYWGECTAAYTESTISMCIHCGAEMQQEPETGIWRHHSQMDLPINKRYTEHSMERKIQ